MLNDLLRALAPFIAQDWVVVTAVTALVVWATWGGVNLYRSARRVRQSYAVATGLLRENSTAVEFAGSYEKTSSALGRIALLGAPWHNYSQSLIVPNPAGRSVAATDDPARWFDLAGLFRQSGCDLRYHAALPGMLVGAGLLFTFLGLAAALSAAGEVVAEGVDQAYRNAALRNLLGAASVKFVTSVAGLMLSISYAILRKKQLHLTEAAQAEFLSALQLRLPFKTTAALQAEGNAVLEKQYADVQRIGSDFFVNLGSVLERTFDQGLHQHVEPLARAIDGLSAKLANQSEDAMQTMLQAFLTRLEGAVGESMRSVATTLEVLGMRLDGLQDGIDGAAKRMGKAAEDMAAGMGRGAESALAGVSHQMAALVDTLRQTAAAAGASNREAGEELARRMATTASSLTAAVVLFQEQLQAGAADSVGRLAGPIEELLAGLKVLTEEQRSAGQSAGAELAGVIGRAADSFEAMAGKVADVLGGGAADASRRLVEATEAMREDLRAVLEGFGATLKDSGAELTRGAMAGGETLRGAAAAISGDIAAATQHLTTAIHAAGTTLREAGNDTRAGLAEATRTLAQGSAGVSERLAALGEATARIAASATAMDDATRAATLPLVAGAADLRAAGQAARDAVTPLQEVSQAVREAMAGLSGTATAITLALDGTAQLAERIGAAGDRFQGVDEALTSVLRSLTDGLNEFREQITRFVADIDRGFAKSVGELSAVANSLEETAEELVEERTRHGTAKGR